MRHAALYRLCLILTILLFSASFGAETYSSVKIFPKTKADYLKILNLGLEIDYQGDGFVEIAMRSEKISSLADAGLDYEIRIEDMTSFYQSRLDADKDMGGYRTLSEIELVMDSIASEHPDIVQAKYSIGQTIEGREIYVMKISDNPLLDEDEAEIFYFAAMHAREVITPEVLIYYMRYLTDNYGSDPEVTYLVDNREMWLTCVLNPDGYYHNEATNPGGGGMWRKNRRNNGDGTYGVDLNRNYGYEWGYDDNGSSPYTSDQTYRGTGPFSEPEAQAARDFIISRNFMLTISYHSYSNLVLWPWGYDYFLTPDDDIFSEIGDSASAWNGYVPQPSHGLYPANGVTDDWGYGEQLLKNKNYALTIEVGSYSDGFWPATSRIPEMVQENLEPNLFYARMADTPENLRVPAPPVIYAVGDVDASYFTLAWHHSDLYNPATFFEVWQLQNPSRVTDDLEDGAGNWDLSGFSLSTSRSHSSSHSLYSGSGNSLDNKAQCLGSIQVAAGDSLKFWTWYDIETGWDYGYVEVATNGSNWQNIVGNITTTYNPHGNNLGNGITGSSGGWVEAKFDLSDYVGQEIEIRFRYRSDSYVNEEGWYVDDVWPLDGFAEETMLTEFWADTTFLVENLQEEEYYFRVRARDAQGQLSPFSELMPVTVEFSACTWAIGDADGNGLIEISDAVHLLAYIFTGGPAPTPAPVGSGDADCSGAISIADAVLLISYVFSSGEAPGSGCSCHDY